MEESCRRVALEPRPIWTASVSWSQDERQILIADTGQGALLVYGRDGKLVRRVKNPGTGRLEFSQVVGVQTTKRGYLIQDGSSHFVELDTELMPVLGNDLSHRSQKGPPVSFSDWAAVDGGRAILSWSDWETPRTLTNWKGGWATGLVRTPIAAPAEYQVLHQVPVESPARRFYFLAHNYFTATETSGYFVSFVEPVSIFRTEPALQRLEAFPAILRRAPKLVTSGSVARFGALERATMPVSVGAAGGLLYLFWRQPLPADASGEPLTAWRVTQIDPERDELLHTVTLPTRARHANLAVGKRWSAVLEKGEVTGVGRQEVPSLLILPTEWIAEPGSPLARGGGRLDVCR